MGKRNYFKRGISYLKRNGIRETFFKAAERLARDGAEAGYAPQTADEETLRAQRERSFARPYRFSILVPVYEPDPAVFAAMLKSVGDQTYGNWELILADSSEDESLRSTVMEFTEEYNLKCRDSFGGIHDKVRYIRTKGVKGIAANTNEALSHAQGDYTALLDHDDVLEKTALFDIMEAVEKKEDRLRDEGRLSRIMVIYTDEDKVSSDGTDYFDPNIKPGFDPVLLCTNNYICHFLAVKTDLAKSVGGFRPEFDGAQDHDFILRCTENLHESEIIHVPRVLYHWRSTKGSTSENPDAKLYAYKAGKAAVKAHLERRGIKATVTDSPHLGFFDIGYERIEGRVKTISAKNLDSWNMDDGDDTEYLFVLADDLKMTDDDTLKDMMSCMQDDRIGAVTGKIIDRKKKVESAGFIRDGDGKMIPYMKGLPCHFSGYMHRASLDRLCEDASPDCMLVRLGGVISLDPLRLKDGYHIYYRHKAVFTRKR